MSRMTPEAGEVQVVGLGQACVDYLGRLPGLPGEDQKMELSALENHCGGPASTAMVTLSRLGVPTAFVGALSDDPAGRRIVDNLEAEGIHLARVKVTPGYTSQFAFIAVTETTGHRTIFWHRGTMPPLTPGDVDLGFYPRAQLLHLDGLMIPASIEAARQARARGMRVVLDAGTLREGSRELAEWVDVLIAAETFAEPLVGPEADPCTALEALQELGPAEVVVTLGTRGSVGLGPQGFVRQPAYAVHVLDTTGAGDVYHGAYIYGVLQGWSMARCMRLAAATAALNCRHVGAQTGIPKLQEVMRFLEHEEEASLRAG